MDASNWIKQGNKPIFEDMVWNKPENKRFAGKLLIIGGNAHGFLAPASAFNISEAAGIGQVKVLLPNVLSANVGKSLENTYYTDSNKSGSFAKSALIDWIEYSDWADCVMLAGDFGKNSETAITLERFITLYQNQLTITHDAIDELYSASATLLRRSKTTLVCSIGQLQKILSEVKYPIALKYELTIQQMVEFLQKFTLNYEVGIVLKHNDIYFCASDGKVSTTKSKKESNAWRVETTTTISVWLAQNPLKQFEALTTAIFELSI